MHRHKEERIWTRSIFECTKCKQRTLPCRVCEAAMTRGGQYWDDELCAVCCREQAAWMHLMNLDEAEAKANARGTATVRGPEQPMSSGLLGAWDGAMAEQGR